MKFISLILPALAIATPLVIRDEDIASLAHCNANIVCPANQDCVTVDVTCTEDDCPGLCFPNGSGLPLGNLPIGTLPTAGLPIASLPIAVLPTTNVLAARATNVVLSKRPTDDDDVDPPEKKPNCEQPEEEEEEQEEEEGEELLPGIGGYDEETLALWGDKLFKYESCGGFSPNPAPSCPKDHVCIDAPWGPDCGMACDAPGICVLPVLCGGFAGLECPNKDDICVDYPNDGCDPDDGGRDCAGICL